MRTKLVSIFTGLIFLLAAMTLVFCAGSGQVSNRNAPPQSKVERIHKMLDELANIERSGRYNEQAALIEVGLRKELGDITGGLAAIYRFMTWKHGHGNMTKEHIEQNLHGIILENSSVNEGVAQTAHALLAFSQGRYRESLNMLSDIFGEPAEPDGFVTLLYMSCLLEINPQDHVTAFAYMALNMRYTLHPEYWYRGARLFSGARAVEYAETCINIAPRGPYANECRIIIGTIFGLGEEDAVLIRSKVEIQAMISVAVSMDSPEILAPLLPLLALPENPATVYAEGALRALVQHQSFKAYFDGLAASSNGLLADRLASICRG